MSNRQEPEQALSDQGDLDRAVISRHFSFHRVARGLLREVRVAGASFSGGHEGKLGSALKY